MDEWVRKLDGIVIKFKSSESRKSLHRTVQKYLILSKGYENYYRPISFCEQYSVNIDKMSHTLTECESVDPGYHLQPLMLHLGCNVLKEAFRTHSFKYGFCYVCPQSITIFL